MRCRFVCRRSSAAVSLAVALVLGGAGRAASDVPPTFVPASIRDVRVLVPLEEALTRIEAEHDVALAEGVVRVDGRAVGLDLAGQAPRAVARAIREHPGAAGAVRLPVAALAAPGVVEALNAVVPPRLTLTFSDDGLPDLRALARLSTPELHLALGTFDAKRVARLCQLRRLRGLTLRGRPRAGFALDDAFAKRLRRCGRLTHLELSATTVSDRGMKSLARLKRLVFFALRGSDVSDAAGASVARLGRLRWLDLGSSRLSDGGLGPLRRLKGLAYLGLAATAVVGPGLKALAGAPGLRMLDLSGAELEDGGLAAIAALPGLRALSVAKTRLGDRALLHLRGHPGLERLDLSDTRVAADGLGVLGGMERLVALDLTDITAPVRALWRLKELPRLRLLRYRPLRGGGEKIPPAVARGIGRLRTLTVLELGELALDDDGAAALRGLVGLRVLRFGGKPLTAKGLEALGGLRQLRVLDLGFEGAPSLASAGAVVLRGLSELRYLRLRHARLDDRAMAHLKGLSHLRYLDLSGSRITDAGALLLTELPALRELWIEETAVRHIPGFARGVEVFR